MQPNDLPPPVERPTYATWIEARRLRVAHEANLTGVKHQQLHRYLLPFGHPRRSVPGLNYIRTVFERTRGEISAADWYPTEVRAGNWQPPADEDYVRKDFTGAQVEGAL